MTIRDINANVQAVRSLSSAATTATRTGVGIDTAGHEAVMLIVNVGAVTTLNDTDKLVLSVTGSQTNDSATGVALASDEYLNARDQNGIAWNLGLQLATVAPDINYQVGLINKSGYRYLFPVLTASGSPSAIVGVGAVLGKPREAVLS